MIVRPAGARKKSLQEQRRSPQEPSTATHGYIRSFDGTRLFYSIEGSGPPLIFCYGLVCSSLHWTYQIDYFRKNYQSIWIDYRGHHRSDAPKDLGTLNVETFARDIGAVLDELKIEKAVLLGHSMGVNVILDFYRQQPHRVAGLVLANGTAKRPLETMFHMNLFQGGFKVLTEAYRRAPRLVEAFWKLQKMSPLTRPLVTFGGFNPHLTAREDIDLYIQQVADMDPKIFVHLIENYDSYDATAWLHTVQVPTLIIAGENDHMIPLAQQELLHQLIPNSRLEVVHHGSHCPQMDLPELVNLKIEAFLAAMNY